MPLLMCRSNLRKRPYIPTDIGAPNNTKATRGLWVDRVARGRCVCGTLPLRWSCPIVVLPRDSQGAAKGQPRGICNSICTC